MLEVVVHIYIVCLHERIFEYFEFAFHIISLLLACGKYLLTSSILLTIFTNFIIPRDPLIFVTEVKMLAMFIMFSYERGQFIPTIDRKKSVFIVIVLACIFGMIVCGYTVTINSRNLAAAQL